jgi:hypothetical protein
MEIVMSRELIALSVADASAFSKSLRTQLHSRFEAKQGLPGHVELLNMLSRAAGFRNFQTLKAAHVPPVLHASKNSPVLSEAARKALGQFDAQGRLVRLPVKYSLQQMVMWALWLHIPARRVMHEREVNEILKQWNTFGDHVTPRREMINMKLMARKDDCSEYRKLPARPTAEVAAFLKAYRSLCVQ